MIIDLVKKFKEWLWESNKQIDDTEDSESPRTKNIGERPSRPSLRRDKVEGERLRTEFCREKLEGERFS